MQLYYFILFTRRNYFGHVTVPFLQLWPWLCFYVLCYQFILCFYFSFRGLFLFTHFLISLADSLLLFLSIA